ncbi:hypothetical protein [Streptomyces shenzhenensis]|uniref:hypothetical protein n=1 Tax=Streptomyces shenzhenensis TaxID=943815 RepID=UPI0033C512F9
MTQDSQDDHRYLAGRPDPPAGLALVAAVLPGHIQLARRLLFDPLSGQDLHALGDIMTRVRDHMRTQPPRSAAPRKRRTDPQAVRAVEE